MAVNPKDLNWLSHATKKEGKKLALMVKKGHASRRDVEAALAEYGDAEPAIALWWLDKWGIH